MKRLKVITYNLMASPFDDSDQRYQLQVAKLRQTNADVICLQEVFSEEVKKIYLEGFKESYEVIASGSVASFRPKLIASALNFKLSLLLLYLLSVLVPVLNLNQVSFWIITVMFSMSKDINLGVPSLLYCLISIKFPRMRDILEGDTLGLLVLVHKSTLSVNHDTIVRHVFLNQAFKLSWTSIFEWCFKPKGYLSMQLNMKDEQGQVNFKHTILLVNTHLNVGIGNKNRFTQVEELVQQVKEKSYNYTIPTILVGDKNADSNDPEIHFLRGQEFCDTYMAYYRNDMTLAPNNGSTWDNVNPLTNGFLVEPNQRLDYIFLKQQFPSNFLAIEHSSLMMNEAPYLSDHFGVMTNFIACC